MSELPEKRRLGLVEITLWTLSVIAILYVGSFALLICDNFVFKGQLIEGPLRKFSPALHTQVGQVLRVVYGPLLWVLQRLNVGF